MNKTNLIRRLRQLAEMARQADGIPSNYKYEVGLRTHPVYLLQPPKKVSDAVHHDDDLYDFRTVVEWAKQAQAGEVVQLYFYQPGQYGELVNVITGWIGTGGYDPMLVDVPGRFDLDDPRTETIYDGDLYATFDTELGGWYAVDPNGRCSHVLPTAERAIWSLRAGVTDDKPLYQSADYGDLTYDVGTWTYVVSQATVTEYQWYDGVVTTAPTADERRCGIVGVVLDVYNTSEYRQIIVGESCDVSIEKGA